MTITSRKVTRKKEKKNYWPSEDLPISGEHSGVDPAERQHPHRIKAGVQLRLEHRPLVSKP